MALEAWVWVEVVVAALVALVVELLESQSGPAAEAEMTVEAVTSDTVVLVGEAV